MSPPIGAAGKAQTPEGEGRTHAPSSVLILPLVLLLPNVRPEKLPNLIAYIAVLVVSGALATFYLFIHPATRVQRGSAGGMTLD